MQVMQPSFSVFLSASSWDSKVLSSTCLFVFFSFSLLTAQVNSFETLIASLAFRPLWMLKETNGPARRKRTSEMNKNVKSGREMLSKIQVRLPALPASFQTRAWLLILLPDRSAPWLNFSINPPCLSSFFHIPSLPPPFIIRAEANWSVTGRIHGGVGGWEGVCHYHYPRQKESEKVPGK